MPAIRSVRVLLFFWLLSLPVTTLAHAQADQKELAARGQYIFAVAGGCACHSEPKGTLEVDAQLYPHRLSSTP